MSNYKFLIKQMALTDFKLRYNSSVLGYMWSLLNPLLIFAVLYIVFSVFLRFEGVLYYQLYLLLGIIIWNFFSEATTSGMTSMQYKASLISKINFPKWIIIIASNITAILTLILNLIVFIIFYIISDVTPSITLFFFILYLPLLILISYGVSLILSSFYLKFRDLTHLWGVLLQVGFWMTPIIYPLSMVPEKYKQLLLLNPMARLIMDSRDVIIYNSIPTLRHIIVTIVMVLIIVFIGVWLFNKRSTKFAEEL